MTDSGTAEEGQLAVHVDGELLLVAGDQHLVEQWIGGLLGSVESVSAPDARLNSAAGLALSSAVGLAGTRGQYLKLSPDSVEVLRRHGAVPTGDGFFHMFVHDGNKFAGNLRWEPVHLAADQALALQSMGASAALMVAIRNVEAAIERVEDKVEDVLVLARAQDVGDVLGRFRFLDERAVAASGAGTLSQTDWDAVAGMGSDVAVTVERLRAYVIGSVRSLPAGAPADERARKLDRIVREGKVAEGLGLLVVAEQSMFLWHRLRLLQVGQREPGHLEAAVRDARAALARAQELDGEMVAAVYEVLRDYGSLRPTEIHRRWSRRALQEQVIQLRTALEGFAAARNAQVSSWPDLADPTVREAVQAINSGARALGGTAKDMGAVAVSGAGRALTRMGERLQRATSKRAEEEVAERQEALRDSRDE